MSINLKLLLGCLVFGLLTLALGMVSQRTNSDIESLFAGDYAQAQSSAGALQSARRGVTLASAHFIAATDPETVLGADDRTMLATTLEGVIADVRSSYAAAGSEEARRKADLALYTLIGLQGSKGEITGRLLLSQLEQLDTSLDGALKTANEDVDRIGASILGHIDAAGWSSLAGFACCFFGLMVMVFWVSRSLVAPVNKATAFVAALATGDAMAAPMPSGAREFFRLRKALNDLRASVEAEREAQRRQVLTQASSLGSAIEAKQNQFQAAMNNMTQGLCMLDAELNLVVFNEPFATLFGNFRLGAPAREVLADPRFHRLLEPHETGMFVHEMANGEIFQVKRRGVRGGGLVVTFENITDQHTNAQRLEHLAGHDALTGLANRRRFRETLQQLLTERPNFDEIAVFYLDLSGFKAINDSYGHPVGDGLLKAVADRLLASIGPRDMAARLGGDEFAIIQEAGTQPGAAEALAETLMRAFEPMFEVGDRTVGVGISVGISAVRERGAEATRSPDMVMQSCDLALYDAKGQPGSAYRFYSPEMRENLKIRRDLEADLRVALERGEFELAYQPFVDTERRCVSGFEALLRWHHPTRGSISPALFIPIAEELGLIDEIGLWVLRTACAQAAAWPSGLVLSVNLSPVQFKSRTLVADIVGALAAAGLPAGRLQLEVTESLFLDPAHDILPMLGALRAHGARIAMDDFGTGYSSLGYLTRFPFDKIKIDQSFVRDIDKPESMAVIRAIIGLSRSMNMAVIAEGIETAEQCRLLQEEGCQEMQGYLFGRPRPASDLAQMLMRVPLDWPAVTAGAKVVAKQA